jgi:hypothetical protein
MILNNKIWQQTVAAAIVAVAGKAAWVRAIERGAKEIERASYWSFDGVTLVIKSTTSGKLYKITAEHTCEAIANGHKACKHRAAHRLMQRYLEALKVSAVEVETKRASMLDEARKAVLVRRTVKGEKYGTIDV